jgi:hypothetical protein
MAALLGAMMAALGAWALWFAVFVGIGLFIYRFLNSRIRGLQSGLLAFWLGWGLTLAFLQLWHLFWPVDRRAWALVIVFGAISWVWNWRLVQPQGGSEGRCRKLAFLITLLLAALWLSNQAVSQRMTWDSGIYHLGTIRWTSAYPIVPGLGNLFTRLAFNQSYFLYAALLDVGPWSQHTQHLCNGLLLLALLAQMLWSGFRLLEPGRAWRVGDLFQVLLLAAWLRQAASMVSSSPTPDGAVFALGIVITAVLLQVLDAQESGGESESLLLTAILLLAMIALTVKLTIGALGGVAALIALVNWLAPREGRKARLRQAIRLTVLLAATVIAPWMARGVILSGYPLFPIPVLPAPVEWRIPFDIAVTDARWAYAMTRIPAVTWERVVDLGDWFSPWLRRLLQMPFDILIPLAIVLLAAPVGLAFARARGVKRVWWVLLPPLVSILLWFIVVPEPRYLGASLWALGAAALALALSSAPNLDRAAIAPVIPCLALALCLLPANDITLYYAPRYREGFSPIPRAEPAQFVTDSGLLLHVARNGPQGDECWDAPLPCTPYPLAELRLRREGELRYGFVLEWTTGKAWP